MIALLASVIVNNAHAEEDWTCTEVASIKEDNSVLACGVATAATEGEAREKALIRAKREFELICETSAECAGRQTIVEPMRNTCEQLSNGRYKCFRGLRYTVLDKAKVTNTPKPIPVQEPTQVAAPASPQPPPRTRPARRAPEPVFETKRPFSIGASTYELTIRVKDSDEEELGKTEFSGYALTLQYAFTKNFALKGFLYSMDSDAVDEISASGTDFRLMWGSNFNRTGFKINIGLGMYSETWEHDNSDEELDFSGALFALGIGYNFDRLSIDAEISGRETSDYEDEILSNDIFGENSLSVTTITVGAAFRF